jgi:RHS repeat-associated protein
VGNRIAEVGSGGNTTYSSDSTNQYTSVSSVNSVAYSDRGDLTQFGDWAYTYDAQGNLIRANNNQTTAQYWRDVSGHRAVKDVNGTKTLFLNLGTTQLEAYDVTNATASSTIYEPGIDQPLAEVGSGGSATFYHQDWLGNVVLLTNNAGVKVERYTYDAWGKPSGFDASGGPISSYSSRFLYTAREYDAETGLYHYRARGYSPGLGRLLQTDPIDFGGGDVNLFRYVANNSLNFIDPLGLVFGPMGGGSDSGDDTFREITPPEEVENIDCNAKDGVKNLKDFGWLLIKTPLNVFKKIIMRMFRWL